MDQVDRGLPDLRPDPEGQTGSESSASSPGGETVVPDSDESKLPVPNMTKSPAFLKLESELENAKKELQLKEKEVDRLSKIRDEVRVFFSRVL